MVPLLLQISEYEDFKSILDAITEETREEIQKEQKESKFFEEEYIGSRDYEVDAVANLDEQASNYGNY